MSSVSRLTWMDMFRGLAIVLVIFHHSVSVLDIYANGFHPWMRVVDNFVAPYRMPGLVFLSGLLVERSIAKGFVPYLAGKIRHIAWPYVIWCAIIAFVVGGGYSLSQFGHSFIYGRTGLWYLWFIFVYYLLMYAVRKVPIGFTISVALALATVLPEEGRISRFAALFAFFALGVFISRHLKLFITLLEDRRLILVTVPPAIALSYMSASGLDVKYDAVFAPWILCGVLSLLFVCRALTNVAWIASPLSYVGRNSLIYYVVQWPLIVIITRTIVEVGIERSIVQQPIVFILALAGCTIMSLAAAHSRVVKSLFVMPFGAPTHIARAPKKASAAEENVIVQSEAASARFRSTYVPLEQGK
ncbi:MAG: acyltransferase family protein [Mycetocola sp.]